MKRIVWMSVAIVLASGILVGAVFVLRPHHPRPPETVRQPQIVFDGVADPVTVMIANTPALRQQGLSGLPELTAGTGMLFFFDYPGKPGFWMKDMRFSIDIVWIGSDWTIVDITRSLRPETYPTTFSPAVDAQYVLEVPAGYAEAHQLRIGQQISFKK